mmetsp:Transcript_43813/g.142163  ORF Transcript_43813/g.142163 Transcript_43813/m.142163 type:complete len:227 (-) Transcript_43813:213-893(-)
MDASARCWSTKKVKCPPGDVISRQCGIQVFALTPHGSSEDRFLTSQAAASAITLRVVEVDLNSKRPWSSGSSDRITSVSASSCSLPGGGLSACACRTSAFISAGSACDTSRVFVRPEEVGMFAIVKPVFPSSSGLTAFQNGPHTIGSQPGHCTYTGSSNTSLAHGRPYRCRHHATSYASTAPSEKPASRIGPSGCSDTIFSAMPYASLVTSHSSPSVAAMRAYGSP